MDRIISANNCGRNWTANAVNTLIGIEYTFAFTCLPAQVLVAYGVTILHLRKRNGRKT